MTTAAAAAVARQRKKGGWTSCATSIMPAPSLLLAPATLPLIDASTRPSMVRIGDYDNDMAKIYNYGVFWRISRPVLEMSIDVDAAAAAVVVIAHLRTSVSPAHCQKRAKEEVGE
jgi:hypothetical protein